MFDLGGLEDGERDGGTTEVEQAAACGEDVLVVAGAEAEEVAELIVASTEPLGFDVTLTHRKPA